MTNEQIIAELQLYVLARVARATGIHANTLSLIKRGITKKMTPDTAQTLAAFLRRNRK